VNASRRHAWVDVTRALCVLLIVLFHFLIWVYFPGINNNSGTLVRGWQTFADITSAFRLPLLFIASGLIVGPRIRQGFGDRKNILRAASNYWLYAVWLTIFAACSMIAKPGYPLRIPSLDNYLLQFVRPRTILWFILALVVWTLILCALHRLHPAVNFAIAFAVAEASNSIPRGVGGDLYIQVLYYGVFFAFGVYAAPVARWLAARQLWWKLLLGAGVFAFAVTIIPIVQQADVLGVFTIRPLKDLLTALSIIPFTAAIALIPKGGQGLAYLGKRTLPIYVLQLPILWFLISKRSQMPWDSEVFRIVAPFMFLAIVVAVALAIHWFLMRSPGRVLFEMPEPLRRRIAGKLSA
jgi:fucose 4-O-acetylase-like acetyltransferase